MSNITEKRKKHHEFSVAVRTRWLDVVQARQYLAGIEALAREWLTTRDPRVLLDTLAVLSHQGANVRELLTTT
jgi:hypothetical protein